MTWPAWLVRSYIAQATSAAPSNSRLKPPLHKSPPAQVCQFPYHGLTCQGGCLSYWHDNIQYQRTWSLVQRRDITIQLSNGLSPRSCQLCGRAPGGQGVGPISSSWNFPPALAQSACPVS
ncbi:hypothetical protein BJX66DRAFT_60738 [Aspergillus keveii]|uniref:Uncharacterized protein n=1 Tax=Aspergillus keveii TaxID=714993 RepID=A0ABR4FQ95_9EURO